MRTAPRPPLRAAELRGRRKAASFMSGPLRGGGDKSRSSARAHTPASQSASEQSIDCTVETFAGQRASRQTSDLGPVSQRAAACVGVGGRARASLRVSVWTCAPDWIQLAGASFELRPRVGFARASERAGEREGRGLRVDWAREKGPTRVWKTSYICRPSSLSARPPASQPSDWPTVCLSEGRPGSHCLAARRRGP